MSVRPEGNGGGVHGDNATPSRQPPSASSSTTPPGRYIGIDLGTTYSAMAWLNPQGAPVTLANSEDDPTTPSVVLFEPSGEVIVGREAKRAALVVPEMVADHVKRDMGE